MNYTITLDGAPIAQFLSQEDALFFYTTAKAAGQFRHAVTGRELSGQILDNDGQPLDLHGIV